LPNLKKGISLGGNERSLFLDPIGEKKKKITEGKRIVGVLNKI